MDSSPEDAATSLLVRRLYKEYVHAYRGILILSVLCMAVVAAATGANAWLMEPILDDVLIVQDRNMLFWVPAAVIGVAIVKGGADYARVLLISAVGHRVIRDVRNDMFAHLMRADLAFYTQTSSGHLISRFTNDVSRLETSAAKAFTGIIKDFLTIFFLVGVMFIQDWRLACIAFTVFPLALFPIIWVGRRMRKISTAGQKEIATFTGLLGEVFRNVREVKTYHAEDHEVGRSGLVAERLLALTMKTARITALSRPLMEILGSVMIAAVVIYGGTQVISGATSPGAFTSFIAAVLLAYQPMKSLASLNTALQDGLAACQRVFALLDGEPSIKNQPDARKLRCHQGQSLPILFENVTFSYGAREGLIPALKTVNLNIAAGQTVALVGRSGSGKSTLLNLIPRLYDVDEGRVCVGDMDVRQLDVASLRFHIALVSQETGLFDETIATNIAYGNPKPDREGIINAAKQAAADDFIDRLPQGYDTPVGERGVRLSGGQRQRIAIARAFFKDAPILLLDEATSALDSEAERQIQEALDRLKKGRTTVVIAHRLSTVRTADCILVLDEGRIVETGTHRELLAEDGVYAKLCRIQFQSPSQESQAA